MNKQEFTVGPEGFKELEKNILIRMIFLFAIVVTVVLVLPFVMFENSEGIGTSTWLTLLLGLLALTYSYFSNVKKQKAMLATYKIIVTDDSIAREMLNTPTITILKSEIQEIVKESNGSIVVIADRKINAIGVSAHLEKKDELEHLLAAIRPLTIKTSQSWIQKFQIPIIFLVLVTMFGTYYIGNKYVASLCGIVFSTFMTYSFIAIQKSKNIDTRTKRLSYFILIPLLSVIFSVIMKLM